MRRLIVAMVAAGSVFAVCSIASFAQQSTAEQRQQIAEANKLKGQVTSHITGRRYEEAGKALEQLQAAIKKLKESGFSDKDPAIAPLEKFVENQKKVLDRHKPKDSPKKDEPAAPPGKSPAPEPAATPGGVSFVKDVAPIFARNCVRCHGTNNPRSKFSLNTYNLLKKGGERGDDIVPGKPEESLLVLLLKGEEQPRMPQGGRSLRADLIEKVETWVKQGARFDGAPAFTPDSTLAQIVPSPEAELKAKVAAMSESELLELHKTKAREHWQTGNPSKTPELIETDHFIVAGTLPQDDLEQAGQWAEAALRDVARMMARPARDNPWKGKLTIHLFAERHEYTEHAMMVENRELPPQVNGHRYTAIETSYVAAARPPNASSTTLKGQLVEPIVQAYLATLGESPRWFNVGLARFLAARSDPKAEVYREYRQQIREAVAEGSSAVSQLVEDKGDADLLGFGLIDFLASQRPGEKGLAALAEQLRQKTPADKAVQTVYGLDRNALASAWPAFAAKRYPVAKKR